MNDRSDIDAFADRDEDPPRPRARGPQHADAAVMDRIGRWSPAKAVEAVLCNQLRAGRPCSNLVGVTRDALEALEACNRQLAKRGEAPLAMADCLTCPECLLDRVRRGEDRAAARRERTRTAIRQLKGDQPASEDDRREATWWLTRTFGEGYVRDLLAAIAERSTRGTSKRGRAGDL